MDSKVEDIAMHLISLINGVPNESVRVPVDHYGNPIFDSPRPGLYSFPVEYPSSWGEKRMVTVTVEEPKPTKGEEI